MDLLSSYHIYEVAIATSSISSSLTYRDHLLPEWLFYLHRCPVTRRMYEDSAFLRDEPQIQFLFNLLSTLRTYHIKLEPSITKGLDI